MAFHTTFCVTFFTVLFIFMPDFTLSKHIARKFDAADALQLNDSPMEKRSSSPSKKSLVTMNFQHGMKVNGSIIINGHEVVCSSKSEPEEKPAFFATLTTGNIGPNYADDAIKFNDVSVNVGDGYDPSTGKFTAPVDGIYEINYSYLQRNGYTSHVRLMKDGIKYTEVHANHKNYDQLSKTVLVQLSKDQIVWVQLVKSSTNAVYGAGRYTTFMGRLI